MQSEPKHPVPVFPLPGLVLFPGVQLPLHVFELRYRTLVRDALSLERLIVLALLRPGWEADYHGSPAFFPLGCLARFEEVRWLPDDCYDLRVSGVSRVRLGRPVREFPYRSARVKVLRQHPFAEDDPLVQLERRALVEAADRLARHAGAAAVASGAADEGFEPLVNRLGMALPLEPEERLALLAMDSVIERARTVRQAFEEHLRRAGRAAPGEGRN